MHNLSQVEPKAKRTSHLHTPKALREEHDYGKHTNTSVVPKAKHIGPCCTHTAVITTP